MKQTLTTLLFACSVLPQIGQSQNLGDLDLQAHYTLINTTQDNSGQQADIELINAPYMDTCGVFSFGGYLFDVIDEDSSFVGTPNIDALMAEQFAVQVEFKVDSIEERGRPVIVLGDGWRYLGLFTQPDGSFQVLHNDFLYEPDLDLPLEVGMWHTFTVLYNRGQQASYFFLDDMQIWARADTLVRPENDLRITNTHPGFGWTWRGYWRNLKIYSSNTTTSTRETRFAEEILVSPSPSSGDITVRLPYQVGQRHEVHIYDMHGHVVQAVDAFYDEVAITDLPTGVLVVRCFREGELIAQNRILVTRH